MTDYKATTEQWAELRARVEALEAKYETQRLATLEWGKDVDKLMSWSDQHLQRIMKLEAAQQQPEPFDEEENDRRFKATMAAIDNATPEQIRAAAELPERNSLVERVAGAIADSEDPHELWYDDARAAIREVAAWVREGDPFSCDINGMAAALEQEAER